MTQPCRVDPKLAAFPSTPPWSLQLPVPQECWPRDVADTLCAALQGPGSHPGLQVSFLEGPRESKVGACCAVRGGAGKKRCRAGPMDWSLTPSTAVCGHPRETGALLLLAGPQLRQQELCISPLCISRERIWGGGVRRARRKQSTRRRWGRVDQGSLKNSYG